MSDKHTMIYREMAATGSLEEVKARTGTGLAETILQNCTTKIMLKPSETHD